MKLFQVEDPTGTNSTDWFCTVAEARKNAFELDYSGRLRVIRSLGSDRQVTKLKVHPFVKSLKEIA